jgi:hypothetical protein
MILLKNDFHYFPIFSAKRFFAALKKIFKNQAIRNGYETFDPLL